MNERFAEQGWEHFNEKTKIIDELAGKEKRPLAVVVDVGFALGEYAKYVDNPMISRMMMMVRGDIIKSFLLDYPESIDELEEADML